jgi:hypothetical protein
MGFRSLVVLVILFSIFACGCVQEDTSDVTEAAYDDEEFAEWAVPTVTLIESDVANLNDAMKTGDSLTSRMFIAHGEYLRDDSAKALVEYDSFNLSPELQPLATELRALINSSYYLGVYSAKENRTIDDIDALVYYAEESQIHADRFNALLAEQEATLD